MSSSSVDVADGTSQLVFSGYSSRLSSYDAYELVVANRYCAKCNFCTSW